MLSREENHDLEIYKKNNLLDPRVGELFTDFCRVVIERDYGNRGYVLELAHKTRNDILDRVRYLMINEPDSGEISELHEVYNNILLMEAQNKQVDAYFLYLEKNRDPKEKFYQPRRRVFLEHGITQGFQDLIDDKLDILCISLPPGTGKTTAEKFFHSAVIGWFPKDYSLFYSHSGEITGMYYRGVYQIVSDAQEYTWNEIFPGLQVTSTNAKSQQFNVGSYKPFPSLQTASVGSENAGKVRASKFLFVDDMIGKLEEALNKNILDKLWSAYAVDARQRKTKGTDGKFCKELHLATRWSVHDVIGRVQRAYEGNDRVKAIAIPDIDPETGKSNFTYDIGGFTVEDFKDQELLMDEISYRCLYKQDPIEREGLLYHPDEVRTYDSLPLRDPDEVLGICDTKNTGTDFMFVPCFYRYGDDYYLVDCVCDQTVDFDVLFEKIVGLILENGMQRLEIESNQGGKPIGTTIRNKVMDKGWACNITEKPTESNKEARIIANSYWVKKRVLFRNKSDYAPKSDYGIMMGELFTWTQMGKNPHDDVPDGLANFALFVAANTFAKIEPTKNPFM